MQGPQVLLALQGTSAAAGLASGTGSAATPAASSTYYNEVIADAPSVYWRLGESSGTFVDTMVGNDATATGTPTRDVANSSLATDDGGVSFPTTSDYITAADSGDTDLGDGPFTLEFWASRSSDSGADEFLFSETVANSFGVLVDATDKLALFRIGTGVLFKTTASVPANGSWHHYVITRSAAGAGNTHIYVDAVEDTSAVDTASTLSSGTAFVMGQFPGGVARWTGALDELALYKSVLSASRVADHFLAAGVAEAAGGATNAAAGVPSGTGTAAGVTAKVSPTAGNATGTGSALGATTKVAATSGLASGTGAASGATIALAPTAGAATGTGAAQGAKATVSSTAGNATGTGTVQGATTAVAPVVGSASGTGLATDPSISTSSGTNATAEVAAGTGAAANATTKVSPTAGLASGSGSAFDATVTTAPGTVNAQAGLASGTGSAFDVSIPSQAVGGGGGRRLRRRYLPDFEPLTEVRAYAGIARGWGRAFDATIEWDDDESALLLLTKELVPV